MAKVQPDIQPSNRQKTVSPKKEKRVTTGFLTVADQWPLQLSYDFYKTVKANTSGPFPRYWLKEAYRLLMAYGYRAGMDSPRNQGGASDYVPEGREDIFKILLHTTNAIEAIHSHDWIFGYPTLTSDQQWVIYESLAELFESFHIQYIIQTIIEAFEVPAYYLNKRNGKKFDLYRFRICIESQCNICALLVNLHELWHAEKLNDERLRAERKAKEASENETSTQGG